MKRSERYFRQSRECGVMAVVTLMASVAIVCWVPMAFLSGDSHPGGMAVAVAMGALGLLGIVLAIALTAEAVRLSQQGYRETRWEWHREVRPKL